MQAQKRRSLRNLHLVIDGVVVAVAALAARAIQGAIAPHVPWMRSAVVLREYVELAALVLPMWLALVVVFGLHRAFERVWGRAELVVDLIKLHLAAVVVMSVILFVTQGIINRSLVGLFLIASFSLMFVERAAVGWWVRYQHRRGQSQTQLLLIGEPSARMAEFVRDARQDPLAPHFAGYLGPEAEDLDGDALPLSGVARLGDLGDIGEVLHKNAVDQAVFFPPYNRPDSAQGALERCEEVGVQASFAVDLVQLSAAVPRIGFLYERPFVEFDVAPKRPAALAVKHGLDVVLAFIGIALLSPVLLGVSVAIAISMGRPVFFVQERAGLHGRKFRMFKFRTMVADAEARKHELAERNEMTGPVFKVSDDPRVTRLGSFLRKSSIDELPQLFNVVTGAMSLVGPRPLPLAEQESISGWQRRRLSMKPGITGLWQISGRSNIDFEEWMALDLRYIDDWSLGQDLRILLGTLPAVLRGKGAH